MLIETPTDDRPDSSHPLFDKQYDGLINPSRPLAAACVGSCLVALLTFLLAPRTEIAKPADQAPQAAPVRGAIIPSAGPQLQLAAFYDASVEPEIQAADRANRQSAVNCIKRIERLINQYHQGVEPFVKDLTSLSTRFGIVRRMPGQWWRDDQRVNKYVQQKFEHHLFSEDKLVTDVSEVLVAFRKEIDANQKRMLINIRASLSESDIPTINLEHDEAFFRAVAVELQRYSTQKANASVINAAAVFVVSEIGVFAARSLLSGLLARFGAVTAGTVAAGTGATASGAATGAGGGALGGPAGAVVGFGIGLAVGLLIDWWMTEKFEAQASGNLHNYINQVGATILRGAPADRVPSNESNLGLVRVLPTLCDGLTKAYRVRFYQQIVSPGETQ